MFLQVASALVLKSSTPVAAVASTSVMFSTNAISGLSPNTGFSYTVLDRGTSASACRKLGTSDADGVLAAIPSISGLSASYAAVGTYSVTVAVYMSRQCSVGAAPVAGATVLSRSSATVKVCHCISSSNLGY